MAVILGNQKAHSVAEVAPTEKKHFFQKKIQPRRPGPETGQRVFLAFLFGKK
jgi:hypothetical protein